MDYQLFQFINQVAGRFTWLDATGIFFAHYAIAILFGIVCLAWFFGHGRERQKNQYAVVMAVEAGLFAWFVIVPIIWKLFPRLRPFVEHDVTLLLNQNPLSFSFPSRHTTAAFALALPFLLYNWRVGIWFTGLALLISVSRVFIGVHYPGDVLGGFVLALFIILFINYLRKFLVTPVVKRLRNEV